MIVCLAEHEKELSPACKEKVDRSMAKLEKARQDCTGDIAAYCPDVKPGGGRLLECLAKRTDTLSPACRTHVLRYEAPPAAQPAATK